MLARSRRGVTLFKALLESDSLDLLERVDLLQTHDRQERRSLHKQKFLRKGQTCNTFNDTGTSQSDYAAITVPLSRVRSLEGLHLACPVRGKEFLQKPDALLTEELQRLEKLERQTVAS